MDGSYQSQEAAIIRRITKEGISTKKLDECFDAKLLEVKRQCHGQTRSHILARTEFLVWQHFFPSETFPGNKANFKENVFQTGGQATQSASPAPKRGPLPPRNIHNEWVHDLYNPEKINSHKQPLWEGNDSSTYKSLNPFMYQKAKDMGISSAEYSNVRERYNKEVQLRYSDCCSNWREWCEDAKTWKHFFSSEPFNGREPKRRYMDGDKQTQDERLKLASKDAKAASATKETREATEVLSTKTPTKRTSTVDLSYISQAAYIERRAQEAQVPVTQLRKCIEEKAKVAELRYDHESKDWQKYFVEASVWGCFFKNSPFPGIEPKRANLPSARSTSSAFNSNNIPLKSGGVVPSLGHAGASNNVSGRCLGIQNPRALVKQPSMFPAITSESDYVPQEKVMEKKAMALNIRHDFFRFLQKTRDRVRGEHPDCTKQIRNYMADLCVWEHFFRKEPFPGIQPHKGHANNCIAKSQAIRKPAGISAVRKVDSKNPEFGSAAPRYPPRDDTAITLRGRGEFKGIELISKKEGVHKVSNPNHCISSPKKGNNEQAAPAKNLLKLAEIRKQNPHVSAGCFIMVDLEHLISTRHIVADIIRYLRTENPEEIKKIQDELEAKLWYSELFTGDLVLWTESITPAGLDTSQKGFVFLEGWIQRSVSFGVVPPSIYWKELRGTMRFLMDDVSTEKVTVSSDAGKEMVATADALLPALPDVVLPSGCEGPGSQLERYKKESHASEVDCLLIEEIAKVEGDLRMVLDKKSGQVITVEELIKRTQIRCILEMSNGEENFGPEMQKIWQELDTDVAGLMDVSTIEGGAEPGLNKSQARKVIVGNEQVKGTKNMAVEMDELEGGGLKRKMLGLDERKGERAEKRICVEREGEEGSRDSTGNEAMLA